MLLLYKWDCFKYTLGKKVLEPRWLSQDCSNEDGNCGFGSCSDYKLFLCQPSWDRLVLLWCSFALTLPLLIITIWVVPWLLLLKFIFADKKYIYCIYDVYNFCSFIVQEFLSMDISRWEPEMSMRCQEFSSITRSLLV